MIRNDKKPTIFAALGVVLCLVAVPASAGPLLDWLQGRNTTVNPAYAAASPAYAAGYAPYAAGYAPYTAGYAPVPGTVAAAAPVTALSPAAPNSAVSGYAPYRGVTAYAPALTGGTVSTVDTDVDPVTYGPPPAGVTAYSPATASTPVTTYAPALPVPTTGTVAGSSLYGTGNLYPDAYTAYSPYAAYSVPATAAPAAVATPAYAVPPRVGPIRRLLRALFGVGYRTTYYRAPVTYYRPVIAPDATGAAATSLSPCTSYQIQTQRNPVHAAAPATGIPSAGTCPDPCAGYASPTTSYDDCAPGSVAPYSGAIQPSAPAVPGSAAPATGYPSGPSTTVTPDAQPLQAPELSPGGFSMPQGVPGTQSSFGSPPRYRQPYSNVKPIPAPDSDSESQELDTRILPGDRTAAVREPAASAAAVRTVAAQSSRAEHRQAFYLQNEQPDRNSTSDSRPAPARKVYERAQWSGVK